MASTYRHDLRHHLQYLSACIENGRTEAAQEYIHSVCAEIEASKVNVYCENEAANLILSSFAARAQHDGIDFRVHAAIPLILPLPDSDLCVLFSNALENALHAGQHQLGDQVGTGGQCGQRHAAAQRLTVQLKQPRLDGQTLSPSRAAFQKRILAAVAAVAFHRTHGQNAPVGIPRQWNIAVAQEGYKVGCAVLRYRYQRGFTAHQCVLQGGVWEGVQ